LLAEVNGVEPIVVRNDEAEWAQLAALEFDNVVLSPGPGRPQRRRDFGVCAEAIRETGKPLLGVCLGHQGLSWVNGGEIVAAPELRHGRISTVRHEGSPLFAGIPAEFEAVRYHSLCAAEPLPAELEPLAWSDDGVLMALAHRSRPQWGVQFHPESVCSEHGARLLANFRDLTAAAMPRRGGLVPHRGTKPPRPRPSGTPPPLELRVHRLDRLLDAERAFAALFARSDSAFWLDSSREGEGGRFSFMGCGGGPLGARVSYDVGAGRVTVERGGETETHDESIFEYLEREMARLRVPADDLPFDFACGFVGYLGYELKGDCGGARAHASPLPDAQLLLADRLLAFDRLERRTYVLALAEPGAPEQAEAWIEATSRHLADLPPLPEPAAAHTGPVEFELRRSHQHYLEDIAVCRQRLAEGESYEVCLTNQIAAEVEAEPFDLYRRLRRLNPSPFAAFLRFGEAAVLSSSPERFLRIGADGAVEAKPIKGTCRRDPDPVEDARLAAELRASEKNRAENLMVTDLLRNDLGSVCEVGSVGVPHLMEVESYDTVHHLVSTVRGRLRGDSGPAACIRACFPGGSMTGAPKVRTMEIIDELEGAARGVYSGAIGYLGLGGGCDLSIAIRTIVLKGGGATIGVGGAIVAQSEPEAEYQESLLKGLAPMKAIDPNADARVLAGAQPR
jgi:para-aminobenzoate synthetase